MIAMTVKCCSKPMLAVFMLIFLLPFGAHAAAGWEGRIQALDAAVRAQDRAALQALIADNFREEGLTDTLFPKPITRDAYIMSLARMRTAFSGLSRTSTVLGSDNRSVTLSVTWQGVHAGPYMGVAPTGRAVTWTSLEIWSADDDGRFSGLSQQADRISLLRMMTDPRPEVDGYEPLPGRTLAVFVPGVFLESVIADNAGALYVTRLFTGEIDRVSPDGSIETAVSLDIGASAETYSGITCLTWADGKSFYATVHSRNPAIHGVWHIGLDGSARQVAALPAGSVPNGLGVDPKGNVYVADSALGTIWRIAAGDHAVTAWFTGDEVRQRSYIGRYPGANGLQVRDNYVYVASSDRALLTRIPVLTDGTAGDATVLAAGVPGDDFAVTADGTAYVTTHPFNSVIRVSPDGSKTVVASIDEGVIGPTAATLVKGTDGRQHLAVVTDGGFYAPVDDRPLKPSVVLLDLP